MPTAESCGVGGPVETHAEEVLAGLRDRGTHRAIRLLGGAPGPRMRVDGREVVVFCGSDDLGLARHPEVAEAAAQAARDFGCAAGGSRLISGSLELHEALEAELADFLGMEAALVLGPAFTANVGVIPALVGRGDLIVSDALNHASLIDGSRLARAEVRVYPHADLEALETELRQGAGGRRRVLVVAEGVYSMDGDLAPLPALVALARRYGAMLLLDDAHGTGTLGLSGRGTAEELGAEDGVDVLVGTLGKSIGSYGAFVAGSRGLRELLVNRARSFIFSGALPPPQVAAAHAALRVLRREPERRHRLQANAERLRRSLAERGISTAPSATHILPVVVGSSAATMRVCERLLERGFFAQGIRPPTVPADTGRLRLTPTAAHREPEIDALAETVAEAVAEEREPDQEPAPRGRERPAGGVTEVTPAEDARLS